MFALGTIGLLISLVPLVVKTATGTASDWLAFTLLWLFLGGSNIYGAIRFRLATSPEGIEVRGLFTTSRIPWQAIEHVVTTPTHDACWLILDKGARPKTNAMLYFLSTGMSRSKISRIGFMWQWQEGIGQDVRQYAPHLFALS
jgi:hypothetical protein